MLLEYVGLKSATDRFSGLSPVRSTCYSAQRATRRSCSRPGGPGFPERPHGARAPPTLDGVSAPEIGGHRTRLDAAVQALALRVNRETVLQARAALLAEAERLDKDLQRSHREYAGVGLCGGDPVSPEAAHAFNERIDTLIDSCFAYNRDLRASATALEATARAYGYTDDEIAASFQSGS